MAMEVDDDDELQQALALSMATPSASGGEDAALQAEVAATLDACNAAWGRTIERHTSPGEFRALTNDELSELTRNLRNPHTPADWPIRQLGRHTDPAPDKSAAVALAIVLNVFHLFNSVKPSEADLLRE